MVTTKRGGIGLKTGSTPFKWNAAGGYQHIPFTGLYHVGAREYDPRTARWLQRDPIDVGGGSVNLYLYCLSDPINILDDGGLQPKRRSKADCEALIAEATRLMDLAAAELSYAKFQVDKEAVGGIETKWGTTTKPYGHLNKAGDQLRGAGNQAESFYRWGCPDYDLKFPQKRLLELKTRALNHRRLVDQAAQEIREKAARAAKAAEVANRGGNPVSSNGLRKVGSKAAKFGAKTCLKAVPVIGWGLSIGIFGYNWYRGGLGHAIKEELPFPID